MSSSHVAAYALALTTSALAPSALAQTYPTRTITIVAPSAAGGPADIAARLIGERMAAALKQPIVIENVAGAGGIQGTARVARAEPDGYALLVHQTGIAIAPAVSGNLSFNVEKDLTTVGLVNTSYLVLAGRKGLGAADLKSLLAWMKTPGNRVRFAHPGTGTLGHLSTVIFTSGAKAEIDLISYRGIAPALNDLVGEHVDLAWPGATVAGPLLEGGKIKAFVIGGPKRLARLPGVPSATEVGMPEIDMPFWHALFAPAATPKPVIAALDSALRETLADPAVIAAYEKSGVEAFPPNMRGPEVGHAFVRSEIARWSRLAPAAADGAK